MSESTEQEHESRDERMRRTRRGLTSTARRLTDEKGIDGFTVEQLCAAVGISRRTFFNYFASKDDAVIGTPAKDPLDPLGAEFVERGRAGGDLLEDIKHLILSLSADADDDDGPAVLMRLARRDPALAERMFSMMQRRVHRFADLIRLRTGSAPDDPFPDLAASMIAHLAGFTMHRFMDQHPVGSAGRPDSRAGFEQLLDEHLRLAGRLFTPTRSPAPAVSDATKDQR